MSPSPSADVVVLTALKDEYDQVLAVDEGAVGAQWTEEQGPLGRPVARRAFQAGDGAPLVIVATWATTMGATAAASVGSALVASYQPWCVAMCGICAGRPGEVALGDVVFADRLWTADTGKRVLEPGADGQRVERFLADPHAYRLDDRWTAGVETFQVPAGAAWLAGRPSPLLNQEAWLLRRLLAAADPIASPDRPQRCPDWTLVVDRLRHRGLLRKRGLGLTRKGECEARELGVRYPDGLPAPEAFRVRLGPLATVTQVVEERGIFDRLASTMRTVLGLEMEAAAIGAVAALHETRLLVAKGVSDLADEDKDDRYRTFAARASAECLLTFLRKHPRRPVDERALAIRQAAYARALEQVQDERANEARALFEEERFEEALELFADLLRKAEALVAEVPDDADARTWAARCRLGVGACRLNLRDHDGAREAFLAVAVGALPPGGRARLAEALAKVGEHSKARGLLPDGEEAAAARQLLEIIDGRVPDGPLAEPSLHLPLGGALAAQGRYGDATAHARAAIEAQPASKLTLVLAVNQLVASLQASVLERPPIEQPVPISERAELVGLTERELARLRECDLPEPWRRLVGEAGATYYSMTLDPERFAQFVGWSARGAVGPDEVDGELAEAWRLARDGRASEALGAIGDVRPAWRGALARVHLFEQDGRWEEAVEEALRACERWPGRAPLEAEAAELLVRAGRAADAVAHAQRAFELLPGRGQRFRLAASLFRTGRVDQAWTHLEEIADSGIPDWLRARARAAERLHPGRAPELWRRYLDKVPDDVAMRVRLAQVEWQVGRVEAATTTAWEAVEQGGEQRLTSDELVRCARMQLQAGELTGQVRRRISHVRDLLARRFAGDPAAELASAYLGSLVSGELDADSDALDRWADAGLATALPLSEASDLIRRGVQRQHAAWDLYAHGLLSFEGLCRRTGGNAARAFSDLLAEIEQGNAHLSTPFAVGSAGVTTLEGCRLLAGELELLLLAHLGLLDRLPDALRGRGRVLLFADVYRAIAEASAGEPIAERSEALARADALAGLLERFEHKLSRDEGLGGVSSGPAVPVFDIVAGDPQPGTEDLRRLVLSMGEAGVVSPAEARVALDRLGPIQTSGEAPLPPSFALTAPALQALQRTGLLEPLLRADVVRSVRIDAEAGRALAADRSARRRDLEIAQRSHRLQRWVGVGLAEEWVEVVDRPEVDGLPPALPGGEPHREIIAEVLTWRQAVAQRPERRLLSADCLTRWSVGTAPVSLVKALAWTPGVYERTLRPLLVTADRDVGMAELVRILAGDAAAGRPLEELARLGFADALGGSGVLRLVETYGGLDRATPRALLDGIERPVHRLSAKAHPARRLEIASLHTNAIWRGWLKESWSDEQAVPLTETLLTRAGALGPSPDAGALDLVGYILGRTAARVPELSLASDGSGGSGLSERSVAGRLWRCVGGWVGEDTARGAALGRGLRRAVLDLDERSGPDGPPLAGVLALVHAANALRRPGAGLEIDDPALATLATLSAGWPGRPLRDVLAMPAGSGEPPVPVEDVLTTGAAAIEEGPVALRATPERLEIIVEHRLPDGRGVQAVMPAIAALLRVAPDAVAGPARELAALVGVHDGRGYALLDKLAQAPADDGVRRDVARHFAAAPWLLLREDPTWIASWGLAASDLHGPPTTLEDLAEVLSEPGPLEPGELAPVLAERVNDGGLWAERSDVWDLVRMASEVPGVVTLFAMDNRLDDASFAQEVGAALDRLAAPHEQPASRLLGELTLVRLAAARRPTVVVDGHSEALRRRLPELLRATLKAAMEPPPEGTPAYHEPALLRLCSLVVQRLAARGADDRNALWFTHRLYRWLVAQTTTLPADRQVDALRALAAMAPGEAAYARPDAMDPARLGRKGADLRLLCVLHAVLLGETMTWGSRARPDERQPEAHSGTSAGLERLLVELAGRKLTPAEEEIRGLGEPVSLFGWAAGATVPDLALQALLVLSHRRFLDLADETRARWIAQVGADTGPVPSALATLLLVVAGDLAAELHPAERDLLVGRARALQGREGLAAACLFALAGAHAAGADELEEEVLALFCRTPGGDALAQVFGQFLVALGARAPDRLGHAFEAVLDGVRRHGADPVPYALALGNVVRNGAAAAVETARAALIDLAGHAPFSEDTRFGDLLDWAGVDEERG